MTSHGWISPVGSTFGGFLDVAQGFKLAKAQEQQLRFHALFSDQVVVPDTFFHCYGPIYFRAKDFVDRGVSPNDPEVTNDIVMASLRSGALIPVLRTDAETLEANYLSDRVDKGRWLLPAEPEGVPVLRFLDRLLAGRRASSQWTRENSRRSYHALFRRFGSQPTSDVRMRVAKSASLSLKRDREWSSLLESFTASIVDQGSRPYFQRGPLERALAQSLHVRDADVYEHLASLRGEGLTDTERLARHLYREMLFYYQVGQGTTMANVAAVTSSLRGYVPHMKALREAVGVEESSSASSYVHRELVDLAVLDALSADDLMSLRAHAFAEYRERIARLWRGDSVPDVATLVDESAAYRRAIASKMESRLIGILRRLLPVTIELSAHTLHVPMLEHSAAAHVALFVATVYAVEDALGAAEKIHEREVTQRLGRAFNNFLSSRQSL